MKRFQIGCDIVENERIANIYQKHGDSFLPRFLSAEEIRGNPQPKTNFLASRWAAKEALYKALKGEVPWEKVAAISILKNDRGAPYISETALEDWSFEISISHEKDYSMAYVMAQKKPK